MKSLLHHSFTRLCAGERLRLVVIGNSVSAGAPAQEELLGSFYSALESWFRRTFPENIIEVVPRIIYAVGPETQLFYQQSRLLAEEPDLVLAEFGAANGAWGRPGLAVTEPATEGYVRELRRQRPNADLILMMGLYKTMLDDYRAGLVPPSADFLHRVARHYNALAVDAGAELARHVLSGTPWETYMKDNIHPSAKGYILLGELLIDAVAAEWQQFQNAHGFAPAHGLPGVTLHPAPWMQPECVPAERASLHGFTKVQHERITWWESTQPEAWGRYRPPDGRCVVGLFMRKCDPPAVLEVRVPGGPWTCLSQQGAGHFTLREEPDHRLYRTFFATSGLPSMLPELEFRLPPTSSCARIVGFCEVAAP